MHRFASPLIGLAMLLGMTATVSADDRPICQNGSSAPANAIAACTRLIASGQIGRSDLPGIYMWRAFHHTIAGDHDRAIEDYNEIVRPDPVLASAHVGRGISYEAKGELDRALADFRRAATLDLQMQDAAEGVRRVEAKLAVATTTPAQPSPGVGGGVLGVQVANVSADMVEYKQAESTRGAYVASVTENGPAAAAGIKADDLIVQVNDQNVANAEGLRSIIVATPPGTHVSITVQRRSVSGAQVFFSRMTLKVTIGRATAERQ